MVEAREKHRVFVGLGNPGKKYEMTRHNMGYLVIEAFSQLNGLPLKEEKKFPAKVGKGTVQNVMVHIIQPTTYMNASGQAVRKYLDYFKRTPHELVVVVDDIALPFGEMRLRSQGTSGGHNGLKSIEKNLGKIHYPRLRVGIGRDHENDKDLTDYVLDKFTVWELEKLPQILERAVQVLKLLLTQTMSNVMNVVNVRKKKEKDHE